MNLRSHPVLIATIAILSGIWLGQKYETTSHSKRRIISHSINTESNQTILELKEKVDQLHTENRRLKRELKTHHLSTEPMQPVHYDGIEANAINNEMQSRLDLLEKEKQQRKAADITDWIVKSHNADSNFELNNELSSRFERENRDIAWAEQQEVNYRQLFSEYPEFQGIALRDAQCRSTQCEIILGSANSEKSNQLFQTVSHALRLPTNVCYTGSSQIMQTSPGSYPAFNPSFCGPQPQCKHSVTALDQHSYPRLKYTCL